MDWDIHHGDGTQSIFAHDPSVHCISIHSAIDLYMGLMRVLGEGTTTKAEEVGHCNIPLLDRMFEDNYFEKMSLNGIFYRASESLEVFRSALEQSPWTPDFIMLFAGYDSHQKDCGEGITDWTNEDFQKLTRYVMALAKKASCRVLSVHGGGYKLPVTIQAAVSHVRVLAEYR